MGCGLFIIFWIRKKKSNVLCYRFVPGDGGRRVDSKGLDGRRDRAAGFLILIKKCFLCIKRNIFYFHAETMYEYINFSRKTSNATFWSHTAVVGLARLLLSPGEGFYNSVSVPNH